MLGTVGCEGVGVEDWALSWTEKKRRRRDENKKDFGEIGRAHV